MMPRMSGSEVVGAIKADPSLKQIPVVVVSIVSGEHRGHILGAVDLLQKPLVREELLATLQRNLPRTRQKILVVDDQEDARKVMRSLLEPENFEVTEAVNGREALEVLSRTSCDLILLDLLMPEVDGFTFLQTLRANPLYQDLPVVVVTAKELTHQEEEHLRREASDVLQKSAAFGHTLIDVLLRQLK
jgi:CheY-like chemotaxis protein